ncbi:phage tail protein [Jeotgalibacillus terrae]|uniref:Phage tail protein n=1 Tax=Jeotgalibacillus terrae TaxID=587735 RepID=A0ABW5ZIS0_9BACL|nr:phage protein U [Jeotgalibacillus terrae]
MQIGSFGSVVFEVSAKKVLTFDDVSRSGSARWAVHDIHQKKPMPEFLGPGQEAFSLRVVLKSILGVNPEEILKKLRLMRDTGEVSSLIIGSQPVTTNYWYIDDLQETNEHYDQTGKVHSITTTINLKEYPVPTKIRSKPTVKSASATNSSSNAKRSPVTGIVTIKAGMLNCRMSPSLSGKIKKVLYKNQAFKAYGTTTTDITWYVLGGGLYCSANSKYVSFKKS